MKFIKPCLIFSLGIILMSSCNYETSNPLGSVSEIDSNDVSSENIENMTALEVLKKSESVMASKTYYSHCWGDVAAVIVTQKVMSSKIKMVDEVFFEAISYSSIVSTSCQRLENIAENEFSYRKTDSQPTISGDLTSGYQGVISSWNDKVTCESKDQYLEQYGHTTETLTNYQFYHGYEEKSLLGSEFIKEEQGVRTYKYTLSCSYVLKEGSPSDSNLITDYQYIDATYYYGIEQKNMSGMGTPQFEEISFEMDVDQNFIVSEIRTHEKFKTIGFTCENSLITKFNVFDNETQIDSSLYNKYQAYLNS